MEWDCRRAALSGSLVIWLRTWGRGPSDTARGICFSSPAPPSLRAGAVSLTAVAVVGTEDESQ